jgi:hypothetical protein
MASSGELSVDDGFEGYGPDEAVGVAFPKLVKMLLFIP